MNTAFAIEKRVKGHTLAGIVKIEEQYSDEYVKIIVLFDKKKNRVNDERWSARNAETSYNNTDELFISELGKDVYNQIIN